MASNPPAAHADSTHRREDFRSCGCVPSLVLAGQIQPSTPCLLPMGCLEWAGHRCRSYHSRSPVADNYPGPAPRVHVLDVDDEDGGVPAAAGGGTAARSILYCACPPCHPHDRSSMTMAEVPRHRIAAIAGTEVKGTRIHCEENASRNNDCSKVSKGLPCCSGEDSRSMPPPRASVSMAFAQRQLRPPYVASSLPSLA